MAKAARLLRFAKGVTLLTRPLHLVVMRHLRYLGSFRHIGHSIELLDAPHSQRHPLLAFALTIETKAATAKVVVPRSI